MKKSLILPVLFVCLAIALPAFAAADALLLPSGTQVIESEAFRGCGENRIVIPSGVESIGAYAFADSPNLVMIRFPSGEIAIDDTCLSNCPHVTLCAPAGSAALANLEAVETKVGRLLTKPMKLTGTTSYTRMVSAGRFALSGGLSFLH